MKHTKSILLAFLLPLLALCALAHVPRTQTGANVLSQRLVIVAPFTAVHGTSYLEYLGGQYTLPNNYSGYLVYKVSDGTITNTTTLGGNDFIYLNKFRTINNEVKSLTQPAGLPVAYSGNTLLYPYTSGGTNSTPAILGPTFYDDISLPELTDNRALMVQDGVMVHLASIVTAAGTTGSRQINALAGRVNFAAGATNLVVTNSFVTTNTVALLTINTEDPTAVLHCAIPTTGLLTLRMATAPTAETAVGFYILNP